MLGRIVSKLIGLVLFASFIWPRGGKVISDIYYIVANVLTLLLDVIFPYITFL